MATRTLVISNPPHGVVDTHAAAPVLGLIPVELNLKVHYPIPEIWLAEEDAAKGEGAAALLREAGASVVVVSSDSLVSVPAQRLIQSFAFGEKTLAVALKKGKAEIPYGYAMIVVHCVPQLPAGAKGAPPIQVDGDGTCVSEASAFLDLYLESGKGVVRLALFSELADFSGLGARRVPSHARNMAQLMASLEERFVGLHVDHRLVNMQLRRRTGVVTPAARENTRKGFSFASPGLHELLQAIAPSWVDIGQSDLSSRLVYLTTLMRS